MALDGEAPGGDLATTAVMTEGGLDMLERVDRVIKESAFHYIEGHDTSAEAFAAILVAQHRRRAHIAGRNSTAAQIDQRAR